MFIGVISDTHGSFDQCIQDFLYPVDVIWHAGDFGGIATADAIAAFKPLIGVYGNCDGVEVRVSYPQFQFFEADGCKVLMTHIGSYHGRYEYSAYMQMLKYKPDIFVYGHSHILKVGYDKELNFLAMNPGACGHQGIHSKITALRFHIDDGQIHDMEVGEWPRTNSR